MDGPKPTGCPSQLFSYQTQPVASPKFPSITEISVLVPLHIVGHSESKLIKGKIQGGGQKLTTTVA